MNREFKDLQSEARSSMEWAICYINAMRDTLDDILMYINSAESAKELKEALTDGSLYQMISDAEGVVDYLKDADRVADDLEDEE